jgi:hypothetical protein
MLAVLVVVATVALLGTTTALGHRGPDGRALTARLNGENEIPDADEDGRGRARVKIDVEGGEVCFRIWFDNITTPDKGHIHDGDADENGPVVVTFFDLGMMPDEDVQDALERERVRGCVEVTDEVLLQDIKDNPEEYYVNLHNTRYPGGAIRGQLHTGHHGHR